MDSIWVIDHIKWIKLTKTSPLIDQRSRNVTCNHRKYTLKLD